MVIQHIQCEPLGSFAIGGEVVGAANQEQWASDRARFEYVRPYEGDVLPDSLDDWDALIILGGPMAVYEAESEPCLKDELTLIKTAMAEDIPTLGVCLGSQLIAAAAGARVYAGPVKELGWNSVELTEAANTDALFSGFPSTLPVFQLHGDTFDLPPGATLLASSPAYVNQAFRIGNHVYGLQFHIEVTDELARSWAYEYKDYLDSAGFDRQTILDALPGKSDELILLSYQLIGRFLELRWRFKKDV